MSEQPNREKAIERLMCAEASAFYQDFDEADQMARVRAEAVVDALGDLLPNEPQDPDERRILERRITNHRRELWNLQRWGKRDDLRHLETAVFRKRAELLETELVAAKARIELMEFDPEHPRPGAAAEARIGVLEAFVADLACHGLRCDLKPTMDYSTPQTYADGMLRYLRRVDQHLRDAARRLVPDADVPYSQGRPNPGERTE